MDASVNVLSDLRRKRDAALTRALGYLDDASDAESDEQLERLAFSAHASAELAYVTLLNQMIERQLAYEPSRGASGTFESSTLPINEVDRSAAD